VLWNFEAEEMDAEMNHAEQKVTNCVAAMAITVMLNLVVMSLSITLRWETGFVIASGLAGLAMLFLAGAIYYGYIALRPR
jgi:hypothetical protein